MKTQEIHREDVDGTFDAAIYRSVYDGGYFNFNATIGEEEYNVTMSATRGTRPGNMDAACVGYLPGRYLCGAVCDGAGGHPRSADLSMRLPAWTVIGLMESLTSGEIDQNVLVDALRNVEKMIKEQLHPEMPAWAKQPRFGRPSVYVSTLTAWFLTPDTFGVLNLGDSITLDVIDRKTTTTEPHQGRNRYIITKYVDEHFFEDQSAGSTRSGYCASTRIEELDTPVSTIISATDGVDISDMKNMVNSRLDSTHILTLQQPDDNRAAVVVHLVE